VAAENRVAGGPWATGDPGQAVGSQLPFPAERQDLQLGGASETSGTPVRPAGPIGQPDQPLLAEPAESLVRGGPRDPQGLRGRGWRPALLEHPADDQSPAIDVEARHTMGREEPSRGPEPLGSPRPSGMALPLSTGSVGVTPSEQAPPAYARQHRADAGRHGITCATVRRETDTRASGDVQRLGRDSRRRRFDSESAAQRHPH